MVKNGEDSLGLRIMNWRNVKGIFQHSPFVRSSFCLGYSVETAGKISNVDGSQIAFYRL